MTAVRLTGDSYASFALVTVNLGLVTIGVPIAIGIAILRHQLFDIDIVINETLVYAGEMLVLGAVYAVSVVTLQAMIGTFAGSSSIVVAASTLLAVALFQPLRSRIQSRGIGAFTGPATTRPSHWRASATWCEKKWISNGCRS